MDAEGTPNYGSQWAAINAVAQKLGVDTAETVCKWVRRTEVDGGERAGQTTDELAELRLRAGERRAAPDQLDPQGGVGFLCAELDRPSPRS